MAQQGQIGQQAGLATDISTLAQTYRVGTPVTEYKNNTVAKTVLGITLSILGGLLLLLALVNLFSAGDSIFTKLLFIVISLSLLTYGISQMQTARRNRGARIYLGSEGLMRLQQGQVLAIRWDQITTIQKLFTSSHYRGTTYYRLQQYICQRSDGTQEVLENSFRRFRELGAIMEQEVAKRLLPGALATSNDGQSVLFGSISVGPQGIGIDKRQEILAWPELKKIKVRDGELTVEKVGDLLSWEMIKTSEMPNLCVLIALVNSITGGQKLDVK
jgi:hypothetical protein